MGTDTHFSASESQKAFSLGSILSSFPEEEKKYRIPHIGWNSLNLGTESQLYKGMSDNPSFYFVHSYYVRSNNNEDIAASTEYGLSFTSSMVKNNIFATQFHPEKSHDDGLKLLQNFISLS